MNNFNIFSPWKTNQYS